MSASMYANGTCPYCGGPLLGDGFKTVLHCEGADSETVWEMEPDAQPVYCLKDAERLAAEGGDA